VQMNEVSDEMPSAPTADIPADILVQVPIPNTLPRPSNRNLYLTQSCNPPPSPLSCTLHISGLQERVHTQHTHTFHTRTHMYTHIRTHIHTHV